jgi:hypothetical protein
MAQVRCNGTARPTSNPEFNVPEKPKNGKTNVENRAARRPSLGSLKPVSERG